MNANDKNNELDKQNKTNKTENACVCVCIFGALMAGSIIVFYIDLREREKVRTVKEVLKHNDKEEKYKNICSPFQLLQHTKRFDNNKWNRTANITVH